MAALCSLESADWLADPDLSTVWDALEAEGGKARIAGGAVRDGLLRLQVSDIDIATTETPERVIELADKADLRSHPTGLGHGTVTVVSGNHAFEVTTLRLDVETYGRHARVEFTDQWELDARRRDFTINALFCDRTGAIYDYVEGRSDLDARRIRFVGTASRRIEEDYLRILRFFRFHARFGEGAPERNALEACIAAKDQLKTLSRERIRQEFLKLLCAPMAAKTLWIMAQNNILELVLAGTRDLERFEKLANLEGKFGLTPDPIRRLAALSRPTSVGELQSAFVLSNEETKRLETIVSLPPITPAFRDAERQTLLYWHGSGAVIDKTLLGWSESINSEGDPDWSELLSTARNWQKPQFPIRGQDLLEAGIEEGQELGRCLQALEDWWVAGGFSAGKAVLMDRLAAIRS